MCVRGANGAKGDVLGGKASTGTRTANFEASTLSEGTNAANIDVQIAGAGKAGAGSWGARPPCTRRPVHPIIHCIGALFHFATPFIFSFWCIRFIAAGTIDPLTCLLVSTIPLVSTIFCCGAGCCRLPACLTLWLGIILCAVWVPLFLLNGGERIHINGPYNATRRIAVVGGGPSGVTAAWVLALNNPQAHVHLYEANARFGGHSDTVVVDGNPIDIGFIFSTPKYTYYNALCDMHGVERHNATISVHYHGTGVKRPPWSNQNGGAGEIFTSVAGAHRAARLSKDIERWNEAVVREKGLVETLMPLDLWLWSNGFSDDFFYSALVPLLTPLFVTQNGNSAQSAGATLNHFNPESGFLSFNASDKVISPPVHHTVGGVQYMYERMVADVAAATPGFRSYVSSPVEAVAPSAGGWRVSTASSSREYDEVVLACNAHIGERLLAAGGDGDIGEWPSCDEAPAGRVACRHWYGGIFRALRKWTLRNTEYELADVTLSRPADTDVVHGESLYNIFDGGIMAGAIDRILHVTPEGHASRLKLRVAPADRPAPRVSPVGDPVFAQREWEHHHFNLWEHLLVFRVLPHFNDFDGVHVAGDWTQSVGQDAAVRSGVRAACAIGLSDETKRSLRSMGMNPADVNAC